MAKEMILFRGPIKTPIPGLEGNEGCVPTIVLGLIKSGGVGLCKTCFI